jgi:hypothetical protein
MSRTPAVASVKTNRGSPDFNEAHHPYCGLLSSMHTWGLYNKRYGLLSSWCGPARNTVSINVADPNRPMVDKMLADELARQERLKQGLAKNPATQPWLNRTTCSRTISSSPSSTPWRSTSIYIMRASAARKVSIR